MITGNRGKAPPCRDPKYFKSPTADAARAAVSREPRRPRKRYSDYTQSIRIVPCGYGGTLYGVRALCSADMLLEAGSVDRSARCNAVRGARCGTSLSHAPLEL